MDVFALEVGNRGTGGVPPTISIHKTAEGAIKAAERLMKDRLNYYNVAGFGEASFAWHWHGTSDRIVAYWYNAIDFVQVWKYELEE